MNSAAGATILEQAARLTTADRALHLRMDSGTVRVENSGGIAIGGITPGVAPKSTWLSSSKGGAAKDRCSIM